MCKVIAEISSNHQGSLERALALIDACATAGTDAVKIQAWKPGTMVLDHTYVLRDGPWVGTNLYELYQRAETPPEWIGPIFARARERGIECFASVFDRASLETLEVMGCPRYKIASFELVDLPLIRAVAAIGKPMILSTGMASSEEIDSAVQTAHAAGCRDLTLLKCTSAYPADGRNANLATMRSMASRWNVKTGLSDHTPGIGIAIAAAAMGASMIEKHVTLSRAELTLDREFSIEPAELAMLVQEAKHAAGSWGEPHRYGASEHEGPQVALRRSLYFARDLPVSAVIGEADIVTARPARGIPPKFAWRVIGGVTRENVRRGQPVLWENVILRSPVAPVNT